MSPPQECRVRPKYARIQCKWLSNAPGTVELVWVNFGRDQISCPPSRSHLCQYWSCCLLLSFPSTSRRSNRNTDHGGASVLLLLLSHLQSVMQKCPKIFTLQLQNYISIFRQGRTNITLSPLNLSPLRGEACTVRRKMNRLLR